MCSLILQDKVGPEQNQQIFKAQMQLKCETVSSFCALVFCFGTSRSPLSNSNCDFPKHKSEIHTGRELEQRKGTLTISYILILCNSTCRTFLNAMDLTPSKGPYLPFSGFNRATSLPGNSSWLRSLLSPPSSLSLSLSAYYLVCTRSPLVPFLLCLSPLLASHLTGDTGFLSVYRWSAGWATADRPSMFLTDWAQEATAPGRQCVISYHPPKWYSRRTTKMGILGAEEALCLGESADIYWRN